ncbi:hypothetical protein BD324DRAFT_606669 [Kockovaella imperatae]|uniref:Uncharacterized protein n=1 Tax=Kockovaella imperatae TaxID=4999 RepID=A0A1Y1USL2_9TREE|nr:hypothetical protein BD324DRAFT_606669 [Kockovaella imperatae]ORX40942.1 hypothetical protein BD324DRAFT_606669 [Kockovaella imperatae]
MNQDINTETRKESLPFIHPDRAKLITARWPTDTTVGDEVKGQTADNTYEAGPFSRASQSGIDRLHETYLAAWTNALKAKLRAHDVLKSEMGTRRDLWPSFESNVRRLGMEKVRVGDDLSVRWIVQHDLAEDLISGKTQATCDVSFTEPPESQEEAQKVIISNSERSFSLTSTWQPWPTGDPFGTSDPSKRWMENPKFNRTRVRLYKAWSKTLGALVDDKCPLETGTGILEAAVPHRLALWSAIKTWLSEEDIVGPDCHVSATKSLVSCRHKLATDGNTILSSTKQLIEQRDVTGQGRNERFDRPEASDAVSVESGDVGDPRDVLLDGETELCFTDLQSSLRRNNDVGDVLEPIWADSELGLQARHGVVEGTLSAVHQELLHDIQQVFPPTDDWEDLELSAIIELTHKVTQDSDDGYTQCTIETGSVGHAELDTDGFTYQGSWTWRTSDGHILGHDVTVVTGRLRPPKLEPRQL